MQLKDLVKPMDQMSDDELLERLRVVRANRTTVRPAAKDHVKREAKKGAVGRINKVDSLLNGLTPEQKAELIKSLGG